jgi:hypothetical protein
VSFTLGIIAIAVIIALLAGAVGCLLCVLLVPWYFAVANDRAFIRAGKHKEKP